MEAAAAQRLAFVFVRRARALEGEDVGHGRCGTVELKIPGDLKTKVWVRRRVPDVCAIVFLYGNVRAIASPGRGVGGSGLQLTRPLVTG
jgi:hypothetical protein